MRFALTERYNTRKQPVTKHADVSAQKLLVSPAESTAQEEPEMTLPMPNEGRTRPQRATARAG